MTTPNPWDQQPNEGPEAFEAFKTYRDLRPSERSQERVWTELGKSKALISRWSAQHHWVDRVRAWEQEQDRQWQEDLRHERRRAAQRHIRMSQLAQSKVSQQLMDLDPARLSNNDLTRLFESSVKIEREAMGVAAKTEVSGPDGGPIEVDMSPEERREWLEAASREIQKRLAESRGEEPGEGDGSGL